MARAITTLRITIEVIDWSAIVSLLQCASGMTSMGLNASAFVKPT